MNREIKAGGLFNLNREMGGGGYLIGNLEREIRGAGYLI